MRRTCNQLATNPIFDMMILICILAGSGMLAYEGPSFVPLRFVSFRLCFVSFRMSFSPTRPTRHTPHAIAIVLE